jgi:hypothetical protein
MDVKPIKYHIEHDASDDVVNLLAPKWPFRMLFVGGSGAGKTTAAYNLAMKHITYDYVFVYSKYYDKNPETKAFYDWIKKKEEKAGVQLSYWSNDLKTVVPPGQLDETKRSLVIFDDMINEAPKAKKVMNEYFTAGRHGGASVICMMQNLKGLPPDGRQSIDHIALFGGRPNITQNNLNDIADNFSPDIQDHKHFTSLYKACTAIPYGFLYMDLTAPTIYERYRFGYDCLYNPKADPFYS